MLCLLQKRREPSSRPNRENWDEQVGREVRHQALIEAAFDAADSSEQAGDLARALAWLGEAERLSGELPPEYRRTRSRLCSELEVLRARAVGG